MRLFITIGLTLYIDMEKKITIENKNVLLRTTAGVLIHYKQQFGRDYNEDYVELSELSEQKDLYAQKFAEIGFGLLWSMARTADRKIEPPSLWLRGTDGAALLRAIIEASELFSSAVADVENPKCKSDGKEFSVEALIAEALICGLTIDDLDEMPLPMVLGTIEEWCRLKGIGDDVKEADQEDFDNF